jgi:predicted nucleotidyltransferase component of viral defense system
MTLYEAQNQVLDLIFSHGEELFGRNAETLILAGRTALSRGYLNHRISYDLDFFLADPFSTEAL